MDTIAELYRQANIIVGRQQELRDELDRMYDSYLSARNAKMARIGELEVELHGVADAIRVVREAEGT